MISILKEISTLSYCSLKSSRLAASWVISSNLTSRLSTFCRRALKDVIDAISEGMASSSLIFLRRGNFLS